MEVVEPTEKIEGHTENAGCNCGCGCGASAAEEVPEKEGAEPRVEACTCGCDCCEAA
jgi:hypothetical protein